MQHPRETRFRRSAAGVAALLAVLACAACATTASAERPPLLGLNDSPSALESHVPDAVRLGARIARLPASWALIEPEPGVYDWSQLDGAVAALNASHIRVLFSLGAAPPWAAPDCDVVWIITCAVGPGHESDYVDFATALLDRYPGSKVQSWNEPDLALFGAMTPERAGHLTRMLAEAAPGRVVGPAPSPSDPAYLDYASRMYSRVPRWVPMAFHLYPRSPKRWRAMASEWRHARAIAAGRSIWVTEIGFAERQYGPAGQARKMVAAYRYLARHGARAIIVFRLQDINDHGSHWLASFGLLTESGKRKPAFGALRRTASRLAR